MILINGNRKFTQLKWKAIKKNTMVTAKSQNAFRIKLKRRKRKSK